MTKRGVCKCLVPLLLGLFLLLAGCSGEQAGTYEVTVGENTFTVDREAGTISGGGQVCRYTAEGDEIRITYPDGASYFEERHTNGSTAGWNDLYESGSRVPGEVLTEALTQEVPKAPGEGGMALFGLLLIALGIWNVASPRSAWYLSYGWRYKNVEPSDAALVLGRVGGGVGIVAGAAFLFL